MGTKANPTLIGIFIVGAVILLIAAVLVFGGGWLFTDTNSFVLYFSGSVNGLNVGAPVKFRGVQIGKVSDIRALFNTENYSAYIQVVIEVDPKRFSEIKQGAATSAAPGESEIQTLIDQGLKGQLQLQSFVTGLLFIDFDFHPGTPVHLVGLTDAYPELPTIPTTMEEVFATVRQAMQQLDELQIDRVLNEVKGIIQSANTLLSAPEIKQSLRTLSAILEKTDRGLEDVIVQVPQLLQSTDQVAQTAQDILGTLRATFVEVQQFVKHIDGKVEPLADNSQDTLTAARRTLEQIRHTLAVLETATTPAMGQAERAFGSVADLSDSEAAALTNATAEIASAARAIRILAEYLQRNPQALFRGKGR
jgi:paraquat-inducible protein B